MIIGMPAALDESTDFGRHVIRRLNDEPLIWMTTIGRRSNAPVPSLVWFLWDGSQVLVVSQPNKPKLYNVDANPRVALNLEAARGGDDVAVISGTAVYDHTGLTGGERESYAVKYADGIARLGFASPPAFLDTFSELIRITPERVRGFN